MRRVLQRAAIQHDHALVAVPFAALIDGHGEMAPAQAAPCDRAGRALRPQTAGLRRLPASPLGRAREYRREDWPLRPNVMTPPRKATPLDLARRWAQAPGEDALLRVQPVFRLVEH